MSTSRHRRTQEHAYRKPYDRAESPESIVRKESQQAEQSNGKNEREYESSVPCVNHELVSTNQAINLTCTLAALSGLFALFLYFNDHRSRAVRKMSVQSIGLMAGYALSTVCLMACQAFFGLIPIVGVVMGVILWVALVALSLSVVYLKIQMMKQGYQGYAYQLPVIGGWIKRFE